MLTAQEFRRAALLLQQTANETRDAAEVYHPISRMYQTTMAKADEYAAFAKKFRAEARLQPARSLNVQPSTLNCGRAPHSRP